jgi:hypothetical protein
MDRGVIVGGGLMAASFLVAVLLNRSAHEETPPMKAVPQPPAHVCEELDPNAPVATPAGTESGPECKQPPVESARR